MRDSASRHADPPTRLADSDGQEDLMTTPPNYLTYKGVTPQVADNAFVATTATLIGDVEVGDGASVWFGCVLRADTAPIRIGARSNVQDLTLIHVDPNAPTIIGSDVTIGHSAIVHACTIGDGAQIGMGAIVLSRATIGAGAIVAAGAVVPEGAVVEPNTLVMGMPAKPRREVTEGDRERTMRTTAGYVDRAQEFRAFAMHRVSDDDTAGDT